MFQDFDLGNIRAFTVTFVLVIQVGSVFTSNSTTVTAMPNNGTTTNMTLNVTTTLNPLFYVGENLSCYHCSEDFKHVYVYDTPCQRRLGEVDTRFCGASDRYCQTERKERNGITISLTRGCVQSCSYGCRNDKFGLTTLTCRSCCRGPNPCNTDNGASTLKIYLHFLVLVMVFTLVRF